MSRYDGLIIPRSYNEYINKTDPVAMSQALQLNGVMDAAPTSASNKPAKSGGIYSALQNCQSKNYLLGLTDANDVVNNIADMYRVSANTANIPVARIGLLQSYKYTSGQYIRVTQLYFTNDEIISSGRMFIRWGQSQNYESNLTWSAWKEVSLI